MHIVDEYGERVKKYIIDHNYFDGTKYVTGPLPPQEDTRSYLEECFKICSDRSFRVILVEDIKDYRVFIQLPGTKTECDFFVWRAIYKPEAQVDIKVPSHDDLGKMFLNLKKISSNVEEYLINAVIRMLRDRMGVEQVIKKYFEKEPPNVKINIKKFLATLKWIGLQEDTNYPPPRYLGSKFTLAVYALLESGFSLRDLRRVIKFKI